MQDHEKGSVSAEDGSATGGTSTAWNLSIKTFLLSCSFQVSVVEVVTVLGVKVCCQKPNIACPSKTTCD